MSLSLQGYKPVLTAVLWSVPATPSQRIQEIRWTSRQRLNRAYIYNIHHNQYLDKTYRTSKVQTREEVVCSGKWQHKPHINNIKRQEKNSHKQNNHHFVVLPVVVWHTDKSALLPLSRHCDPGEQEPTFSEQQWSFPKLSSQCCRCQETVPEAEWPGVMLTTATATSVEQRGRTQGWGLITGQSPFPCQQQQTIGLRSKATLQKTPTHQWQLPGTQEKQRRQVTSPTGILKVLTNCTVHLLLSTSSGDFLHRKEVFCILPYQNKIDSVKINHKKSQQQNNFLEQHLMHTCPLYCLRGRRCKYTPHRNQNWRWTRQKSRTQTHTGSFPLLRVQI